MDLAYIIAPYSGATHIQIKQNILEAQILAQYYWSLDYAVICPHLNTAFFSGLVPEENFYKGTELILSKCDLAVVHPLFKTSKGSLAEITFAETNNITIHYITHIELMKIKQHTINLIYQLI